ncbi:glycosyltransferase family 4 protein [Lelliottia amnigena]|jgi:glycosyltransferase involved in cell wall biosynthesis|uniref:glycosyltransferase family 4 protein n=1 Tax=Lelliottia amnigena TaxID=61646 RepID=UPI00192A856E|nr:glycosyltransferase family 4 protein [Lelliottia amnigena]MBL5922243.1 glycosyltransferase family 4 protein [Lelliottia amnigena]MBL5930311.1 glycosyltransferase family 4 protein [Lelliottia amnigena]MBL5964016.1 glycosyltransferase family 4 protein [Lelliottia amnigena]QXZ21285.1 glycosyltransferase family 4 protein [Lelliottia amnigena]
MNDLYVSVERRYKLFAGVYYVQGIEDSRFFERYLDCFSKVNVIARVEVVNEKPIGFKVFTHGSIQIVPIITAGTGILNVFKIIQLIIKIKKNKNVLILRTPGILSYLLSLYSILLKLKFSLEVVTNPLQEASNLTKNELLKFVFVKTFTSIFKLQLRYCSYASFVTKNEIQNNFLTSKECTSNKFNNYYSSIILDDSDIINSEAFEARLSRFNANKERHLIFIGVLDRPFKGLDIFIRIIADLPEEYHATVIGDGILLESYKQMAATLKISHRINFKGYIADKKIKQHIMTSADIFVLTSRREGLPRVVIEAMAWGLPCFCSNVSGVSELVRQTCIFPVEDVDTAREIIMRQTPDELANLSRENLDSSLQYKNSVLKTRRMDFYKKVICSENFTFK